MIWILVQFGPLEITGLALSYEKNSLLPLKGSLSDLQGNASSRDPGFVPFVVKMHSRIHLIFSLNQN